MSEFIVGLDIGKVQDYSAIAIIEEQVYCPPLGGWVSETAIRGEIAELWNKSPETRQFWGKASTQLATRLLSAPGAVAAWHTVSNDYQRCDHTGEHAAVAWQYNADP